MSADGCSIYTDDERILEGLCENRTKIFRPSPIYWEILRRHPDLPGLREAARGKRASNLVGRNLIDRLDVFEPQVRGPAFYLITLFCVAWPDLPGDVPQRFEQYIPPFSRVATGGTVVVLGHPITQVRRQQQRRVPVYIHKSLGHRAT